METAKNPFDELTSLFLGASQENPPVRPMTSSGEASHEPPSPRSSANRDEAGVTIALCGHLPVMAGLWVTQYAEKVAAQEGPTGLVRLEGGRCLLEILRPDSEAEALAEGGRPIDLGEHVTALASGPIRRWIVCVDDRDAAASVRAGASEVVIITSADKPAVVEAYRLAKSAAARVVDPESLQLGLVLVGLDDDQAEKLSGRLAPVIARHLDRELPVRATVKRIDVVEGSIRQMFEESARVPAEEIVKSITKSLAIAPSSWDSEHAAPGSTVLPLSEEGPQLKITSDDTFDDVFDGVFDDVSDEALKELQEPIRLSPSPARVEPPIVDQELSMTGFVAPATPATASSESSESKEPPVSDTPSSVAGGHGDRGDLSRLLGLHPVDWHLPNASGVEYGCDEAGRLHLVARDGDAAGLHVAAAWIRGQQDQFAAFSGVPVESVGDPDLHVVTEEPPRVADLHRSGLYLHLLVRIGSEMRVVPLNDDQNRNMSS